MVAGRAALGAVLAFLVAAPGAQATDVTRAELSGLAERASSDPAALGELRAVTSVEGAPVDMATALDGAEGAALDERLEALAESAEATPSSEATAEEARVRVQEILAGDPPPPPPSSDGGEAPELPGIPLPLAILAALAILVVAALAARSAGQRTILEREAAEGGVRPKRSGARDLAKEADDAERRGDFAAAVRLRFQAGLVRLDELGSVELRPSLTASGAARESGINVIDGLAAAYERVAFGAREASAGDAETQRSGWREAVDEAKRRT